MNPERRYNRNTFILLVVVAFAMAAAYGLLAVLFREAFAAEATIPRFALTRAWRGPYTLFAVFSLCSSLASSWVAEQRGIVSLLTVASSGFVAVGLGYLIALACIRPLPGPISAAFVVSAIVFIGTGLIRQYLET